jgi:hypothetical protein
VCILLIHALSLYVNVDRPLTEGDKIAMSMELLLAIQTRSENTFTVIDEHALISQSSARQAVIDAICRDARNYEKQVL